MRPRDRALAERIRAGLTASPRALPGIQNAAARDCLIEQILESVHRVRFVSRMLERRINRIGDARIDPSDLLFDPLKAAMVKLREGDIDEACWLVFLFIHFGKNSSGGWRYAREVYGQLNQGGLWDWATTSADPTAFRDWLHQHQAELKRPGVAGGFGNHRKYTSLNARSASGTGAAIETYVNWVGPTGHEALFQDALRRCGNHPRATFTYLYKSMNAVASFGRTGRFDYLTMIGKLEIAAIEPGSAYMSASTGPVAGARLLFNGNTTAGTSTSTLDSWIVELDQQLQVGMQVLEDALCNWQKSPTRFRAFRG